MPHFNLSPALISKEKNKNQQFSHKNHKQTKQKNIEGGEERDWTVTDILSPRSQANNQRNKSKPQIKKHA